MSEIDKVEFLEKLIRTYSPSGKEKPVAKMLAQAMKKLGFEGVRFDKVGNVIGSKGKGREILLFGHMDTVPGRLPVKRTGKDISGRGVVDAKASLAALLFAASGADFDGKITFAGVVEEEIPNGRGVASLLRHCKPILAINGEPSGTSGFAIAYKGRVALIGEAQGEGGHASRGSETAFDNLSAFLESLKTIHQAQNPFDALSANPTYVSGGSKDTLNVVPSTIKFALDMRIPPDLAIPELKKTLQQLAGDSIKFKILEETPAASLPENHALAKAFVSAIRSQGMGPRFIRKMGTSDMNAAIAAGIPTISYGPGDAKLCHTDKEVVAVSEYLTAIEVIKKAVGQV